MHALFKFFYRVELNVARLWNHIAVSSFFYALYLPLMPLFLL